MLEELKERVLKANLALPKYGLVTLTWGNASEMDRESGLIVIKPSGVEYSEMKASDMVVVDGNGVVVEGSLKPSSDTPTHIELYRAFPEIGGVVHTHSRWATVFAQAGKEIPTLGTTHADYFFGAVPCARALSEVEIAEAYEKATGIAITELFFGKNPLDTPAALAKNHGAFTWGVSAEEAVHNAVVLEEVAFMAWHTLAINPEASLPEALRDKHYFRKHGKNAYYGQN